MDYVILAVFCNRLTISELSKGPTLKTEGGDL